MPLNEAAVQAIEELRKERDFCPAAPLVSDKKGNYTCPVNFSKRYYRILKAAGIEQKGLEAFRHTFGSSLVKGVKQPDGTIKALSPRQVADLLGHSTSQITEMYYVKKTQPACKESQTGSIFSESEPAQGGESAQEF